MTTEIFDQTLRDLLHRRPFQPFVVELSDGERFVVDDPQAVALGTGAAGYIGPEQVYFFNANNVRHFLALVCP